MHCTRFLCPLVQVTCWVFDTSTQAIIAKLWGTFYNLQHSMWDRIWQTAGFETTWERRCGEKRFPQVRKCLFLLFFYLTHICECSMQTQIVLLQTSLQNENNKTRFTAVRVLSRGSDTAQTCFPLSERQSESLKWPTKSIQPLFFYVVALFNPPWVSSEAVKWQQPWFAHFIKNASVRRAP